MVDLGLILYWFLTLSKLIPASLMYSDYTNPMMVHWNWSFFPLDLCISGTGLFSIYLHQKHSLKWKRFAILSLLLTSVSGLQAISFWLFARDFDLWWWLPNLFLLIYPWFYIPKLVRTRY